MSTPFDLLEQQLNDLRPSRLPVESRRSILHEMQRPVVRRSWAFWQLAHRTGFQVALAGTLTLALLMGWPWLFLRPVSPVKPAMVMASNGRGSSLAFWETQLALASPVGRNTVAVLRSPSILTNLQIRR